MKQWAFVWVVLVVAATGVYASSGEKGLTLKAGTTGFGADLTLGVSEKVNVRLSGSGFSYTYDDFEFDDEDEAEIDEFIDTAEATLDLLALGAFLDWHPWAGGFRLSTGLFYNGNELSVTVKPGDTISINDVEYELQSLDGSINFNTVAPYLGLGWGNVAIADSHWHFALDLGVLFQGSPKVDMTATATDQLLQASLNNNLAIEAKELEDDLDAFVIYPLLTLGVSYTF